MLIFTVPAWYKSKTYPENCLFIYEQMQALRKRNNQVVVLTIQPVQLQSFKVANRNIRKYDDNGIITYEIEQLVFRPSKNRKKYTRQFEESLRLLYDKAVLEFGKPDVLYAHFSFPAGFATQSLAKEHQIPVVVEEHYSGLMEKRIDEDLESIVAKTVESSDAFICVSEGLKNRVIEIAGNSQNLKVVTNMINPCFTYKPIEDSDYFRFFSLGGLSQRKGFDILIKAFAEEFGKDEKVILRIGGEGKEKKKLKHMISKFGLDDRIALIGQLSREDTLNEFSACNCFVLPSRGETYGLVYREAMAVGRPIISTKHAGFIADKWSLKCGFLTEIDDIEELKKSMRYVYENYDEYNLSHISSSTLDEVSETIVSAKIEDILQNCIDNH